MIKELAGMFSLPLKSIDNIDKFFEKLVFIINKSIEASTLLQKIITKSKPRFTIECKTI